MRIKNHFQLAQLNLLNAEHEFNIKNYTQALILLTKAYPHVRKLIELVYKLDQMKAPAEDPPGDNHP